jgi:hypothetical protein
MGGGYGTDIRTTLQVQRNTYRIAVEYWERWQMRKGRQVPTSCLHSAAAQDQAPAFFNA